MIVPPRAVARVRRWRDGAEFEVQVLEHGSRASIRRGVGCGLDRTYTVMLPDGQPATFDQDGHSGQVPGCVMVTFPEVH